mmetsp:Transcript_12356/g.29015  ORF Transcript_12356/g.29015 Transcript_12356/m.29015 type:complete len:223 (-) Transcript_12356:429-1097(-)
MMEDMPVALSGTSCALSSTPPEACPSGSFADDAKGASSCGASAGGKANATLSVSPGASLLDAVSFVVVATASTLVSPAAATTSTATDAEEFTSGAGAAVDLDSATATAWSVSTVTVASPAEPFLSSSTCIDALSATTASLAISTFAVCGGVGPDDASSREEGAAGSAVRADSLRSEAVSSAVLSTSSFSGCGTGSRLAAATGAAAGSAVSLVLAVVACDAAG